MPNKTIYIRDEDLEKWSAIENRSEWVSERLNSYTTKKVPQVFNVLPEEDPTESHDIRPDIPSLMKEQAVKAFNGKDLKKCKNGHYIPDGRFKCLEKGCTYS